MSDEGWAEIECPCCGDLAAEGYWFPDGMALLCGCAGQISCDSENPPYVVINECACQEERAVIERLIAGHLEVLSRQWWVGTLDSGENLSFCPFCEAFEDEPHLMDRGRDCAWVISARACGIAD